MRWLTGKPSSEADPADAFEDGAALQLQDNAASIAQRAITADDADLLELAMQHTTDAEVRSAVAISGDADLVAKANRMLTVTPDMGGLGTAIRWSRRYSVSRILSRLISAVSVNPPAAWVARAVTPLSARSLGNLSQHLPYATTDVAATTSR